MLWAIICAYSVLIFPIFISIGLGFTGKDKKLTLSARLFGFIKVFNAEFIKTEGGLLMIKKSGKNTFIPYKKLLGLKKSFEPFKDYHVLRVKTQLDIGTKETIYALTGGFIVSFAEQTAGAILRELKPYVKLDNVIYVHENESVIRLNGKIVAVVNLLTAIISLIKIITEKIIYVIRRKQNKFGCRNRA